MEKESLNLRVTPELKARVVAYAKEKGISTNAAAVLLLDRGINTGDYPAAYGSTK